MTSEKMPSPISTDHADPSFGSGHVLPPEVDAALRYAERRRLLLPLLMFVAAHRPLSFVAGQLLFAAFPLTLLFPTLNLRLWGEILSDRNDARRMEIQQRARKRGH